MAEIVKAAGFIHRWGRQVAVAYLILLTVAVVAVGALQLQTSNLTDRLDKATRTTHMLALRLEASQRRICHRLNLLRAGDNVSHEVEWLALSHFPTVLPGLRDRLTWIPLTRSCVFAVDHANSFRPPMPVPFHKRLPAARDLKAGPGE